MDQFFPPAATEVCHHPGSGAPQYGIRLRRLTGGRMLMALGTSRPGQRTSQIVLMHESWLPLFCPWVARQMAGVRP